MKKDRFGQMKQQLLLHLGPEQGQRVLPVMQKEYDALCAAYADQPASMFNHTHNNIFPVVSAFRALMADGMEREQAAKLAQDTFLELMEPIAESIRKMLKFPGLYRLMPWLWKTLMPKMFSESAGFRFRFFDKGKKVVRFDMLECPYFRVCKELDCVELAPTFCTTDDICYGHMHPKLIWNRTKTLARGGDLCDFDLYIPD